MPRNLIPIIRTTTRFVISRSVDNLRVRRFLTLILTDHFTILKHIATLTLIVRIDHNTMQLLTLIHVYSIPKPAYTSSQISTLPHTYIPVITLYTIIRRCCLEAIFTTKELLAACTLAGFYP